MIHEPECWHYLIQAECQEPHELGDGVHHWWSGWPGAFCMGCGADDPTELCLAEGCMCQCHQDEFAELDEINRRQFGENYKEL